MTQSDCITNDSSYPRASLGAEKRVEETNAADD